MAQKSEFGNYHSTARKIYRSRNNPVSIQSTMLTSRYLPAPSFTMENEITPRLNPVAMLNVSGVASMVMNAGNASVKSAHFTWAMDCVINAPTRISAGAVAKLGTAVANGENNNATRNNKATNTLLSPVRALAAIPAALSM